MNEKKLTSNRTPLRNSCLANKPFRSPIVSLTPKNEEKINEDKASSISFAGIVQENSTPKRPLAFSDKAFQLKKRRITIENSRNKNGEENINKKTLEMKANNLVALKKRIRSKRQEIESLKVQLASRKKHNKKDLQEEIFRWRDGCQRALQQFQKEWNQRNPEGAYYDMKAIMSMLNIREDVVKFPNETDLL